MGSSVLLRSLARIIWHRYTVWEFLPSEPDKSFLEIGREVLYAKDVCTALGMNKVSKRVSVDRRPFGG